MDPTTTKKIPDMKTILELQKKVNEIAEENKKKVAIIEAKFEKVQKEAFEECCVCYNDISVKNTCCMSHCDHRLCKTCYYSWLDEQEKNTCPMCRDEIFKNNMDIKEKRSSLKLKIDVLEDEVGDLYHEKRCVHKTLDTVKVDLRRMEMKYDKLLGGIWKQQDILDEINTYKKDPEKWKKQKEKRLRIQIIQGKEDWRFEMESVLKQIKEEYELKLIVQDSKGGYNAPYARKELMEMMRRRRSIGTRSPVTTILEEVDIPSSMFEEDETGYTTPPGIEDRLTYGSIPALEEIYSNDDDSDMSLTETDSMPELEEGEIAEWPGVGLWRRPVSDDDDDISNEQYDTAIALDAEVTSRHSFIDTSRFIPPERNDRFVTRLASITRSINELDDLRAGEIYQRYANDAIV